MPRRTRSRRECPVRWHATMTYLKSTEGRAVRRMLRATRDGTDLAGALANACEEASIDEESVEPALYPGSVLRALSRARSKDTT